MKTLYKNTFFLFAITLLIASCSSDDSITGNLSQGNPLTDKHLIHHSINEGIEWQVYTEEQTLEVGYNEFFITLKDLKTDTYLEDLSMDWMPIMHMHGMAHSAPYSHLQNSENPIVYQGYIIFQMAGSEHEYWELKVSYKLNGEIVDDSILLEIVQPKDGMVKTQTFVGSDEQSYVLAYVAPQNPEVATNDIMAALYKMDDLHNFSKVDNYTIALDPRMPGMGNHGSPNNKDLEYNNKTGLYEGKLSMTMTGYWRLNLQLIDANGQILKGEKVTEDHPNSSLYFELEF